MFKCYYQYTDSNAQNMHTHIQVILSGHPGLSLNMAMWRSWLWVVGSSHAGGESCQLAELSQDGVIRDFLYLSMHFTQPRRLNLVPGIR